MPTYKGEISMQLVGRYHLLPGKRAEAMKWTAEKEKEGIPTAPGWKYLGTYYTSVGFGRFDVEVRHEIENYAAIDAWRESPDSPWMQIFNEWSRFLDWSRPIETAVLQEAS
jgi:hypothetical protein